MKNLAARDWEDMLQCTMPVFEGLLPEGQAGSVDDESGCLLDLLFIFATWHGLAKLRIHTDSTLQLLEWATTALGKQFRHFKSMVCSRYDTKELTREAAARARQKVRLASKKKTIKLTSDPVACPPSNSSGTRVGNPEDVSKSVQPEHSAPKPHLGKKCL